ncbi:type II toxin-antitoxin system HicB family antitoxin [Desulfovibrio sp. TomC]|uniref:type II toxin-antitoxin system HicB family antitoxin n=1 Tax=Desulfovibrio sp. TomC TaxID=1562888 RepID=UPI0012E115D5|nr:type II toxin-antitoxin system HicB family antitoxin [Desulfovibrio sp. TomC]
MGSSRFTLAFDQKDDGRFIAEVQEIPGILAYGTTQAAAKAMGLAIALCSRTTGSNL